MFSYVAHRTLQEVSFRIFGLSLESPTCCRCFKVESKYWLIDWLIVHLRYPCALFWRFVFNITFHITYYVLRFILHITYYVSYCILRFMLHVTFHITYYISYYILHYISHVMCHISYPKSDCILHFILHITFNVTYYISYYILHVILHVISHFIFRVTFHITYHISHHTLHIYISSCIWRTHFTYQSIPVFHESCLLSCITWAMSLIIYNMSHVSHHT